MATNNRADGIVFRFATPDDQAEVYQFAMDAIARADLPGFAEDAGENLQHRIQSGNPHNVLLAEDSTDGNIMIGYIELDPSLTPTDEILYIRGIFLLPEYRRRGIGREMLNIIRDKAKKEHQQLRINAFTPEGKKFWEAFGFTLHHYALFLETSKES